jgi:hypothetical protein
MKKILLFAGALALVLAFSSCKKDYTCECTYEVAGTTTSAEYTFHDTKKGAKDACDGKSVTENVGGMEITYKCAIK